MRVYFSCAEDNFLREHLNQCLTLYDLADIFNRQFPQHQTNARNISKRLSKLGLKKRTHNVRKGVMPRTNADGTVICDKNGKKARVRTPDGYISANAYFKKLYLGENDPKIMIIHLNGNYADFSRDNIEFVSRAVFSALHWRKWIFENPELTKAAILTVRLLEFYPELTHNENQYYGLRKR